jgi:hypothetical protein
MQGVRNRKACCEEQRRPKSKTARDKVTKSALRYGFCEELERRGNLPAQKAMWDEPCKATVGFALREPWRERRDRRTRPAREPAETRARPQQNQATDAHRPSAPTSRPW